MLLTPEERRKGIGGSDVGAIMGANPYCSIVHLYKEKRGEIPPPSLNHAMKWGQILESVVAKEFCEENNYFFDANGLPLNSKTHYVPFPFKYDGVMYQPTIQRSEQEWMYAHPDFYLQKPSLVEGEHILIGIEVKTVSEGIHRKYWSEGEVPPWQYYQVVWYSIITGIDNWKFIGFAPHLRVSGNPILTHDLIIDKDTKDRVYKTVLKFWECLESGVLPEITNPTKEDLKLLYPESTMDIVTSTAKIDIAVERLSKIREEYLKPLSQEEEVLKNNIKSYMGNAGVLIGQEGQQLASFKNSKTQVKTDYKAIVESLRKYFADNPSDESDYGMSLLGDFENEHTKAYVQSRRFLLKSNA